MNTVTIWHNPRCSKSRQTLALIEEKGIQPTIVEYLKNPPSAAEIDAVLRKLNIDAIKLVRRKDAEYKELAVDEASLSDQQWCALLAEHPRLIERPVVICANKARLGRPPEDVLEILP